MKQRIRVVGIVKKEGGVFLLKKRTGREMGPVFWELPTGKIKFGEQPEEAMTRMVFEELGVQIEKIKLKDVVSFLAFESSSQMANLAIVYEIEFSEKGKIKLGNRYSEYKYFRGDEFSKVRFEDATNIILGLENEKVIGASYGNYREVANGAVVYVDGGSRGNPGPAGIGYYILGERGEVLEKGGEFIGFATSRVAEYYALKKGIEKAIELGLRSVRFVGDNLMMINQMNGIYKVKNNDLLPIYSDIKELLSTNNFDAVSFEHVKRELNYHADREVNLAIDRHFDEDAV
ncbi:reverse transcriptase-like protein [Candidatus Saccharibacteria bacterium]|nr:reverse transcriptase-like protein [Candidatus Saccharibacteria bacterium]